MRWWDPTWHMQMMGIFWVVIVAAAVLVLASWRPRRGATKPLTPEQILKRRYASGEIDQSTYERMLRTLREGPGPRGGENERGAES